MPMLARIKVRTPQESIKVQAYLKKTFKLDGTLDPRKGYSISLYHYRDRGSGIWCMGQWRGWSKLVTVENEHRIIDEITSSKCLFEDLEDFIEHYPGPYPL